MPNSTLEKALLTLPEFSKLDPDVLVTTLGDLITENKNVVNQLFAEQREASWENLIQPLEDISDKLAKFFSPYNHLHNVADTSALREAYNEALPLISEYSNEYSQDQRIFEAYKAIRELDEKQQQLSGAQKQAVSNALRDFHLSGIGLEKGTQNRVRDIRLQLTKLGTKFEEHVLDATQKWQKHITDEIQLHGLPESAIALAAQNAKKEGLEGYLLTLDFPCYMPVVTYAEDRMLREEIYTAFVTRASELGPHASEFDNTQTISEILALRHELSNCLGFNNYAEYSLATKMADSTEEVVKFLLNLAEKSKAPAAAEFQELQRFASDQLSLNDLSAWDMAFAGEKLRQEKFSISQEELRPYFPIDRVFDGLFQIVQRLFGTSISTISDVDTWHPDVRVFEVRDADNALRGLFYTDLYAREFKRGGAWMDDCIGRREISGNIQYPVAYLTCNFSPPIDGQVATLTHDEVQTLFHEFGHGLHHMLTLVGETAVAGINGVPWDGVELPSQFLENWCWETEALDLISQHIETGEQIGKELIDRMKAAKNFQAAMQMLRQIELALFDFRLHAEYEVGIDVKNLLDEVRQQVAVVTPPEYNRFQNSFSHIFAGGYAAGYYSYKWAELLSADAFSKFEEEGIFNPETGKQFLKCILERGGSVATMQCFKDFRGREPDIAPLLRHAGLSG